MDTPVICGNCTHSGGSMYGSGWLICYHNNGEHRSQGPCGDERARRYTTIKQSADDCQFYERYPGADHVG